MLKEIMCDTGALNRRVTPEVVGSNSEAAKPDVVWLWGQSPHAPFTDGLTPEIEQRQKSFTERSALCLYPPMKKP